MICPCLWMLIASWLWPIFSNVHHVQRSQTLTPSGDETNKTFTGPIIGIWASIGKSSRNHQNDEMLRPSISSQIDGCLKDKPRVGTNPMWLASWLMFCIIVQLGKVKQFGQVQLWKLPFQNAAFPKWYDFSLFQKQLCLLDPERPAHQNSSKMPSSKIGPSNSWSCGWVHLSVPEKQSD